MIIVRGRTDQPGGSLWSRQRGNSTMHPELRESLGIAWTRPKARTPQQSRGLLLGELAVIDSNRRGIERRQDQVWSAIGAQSTVSLRTLSGKDQSSLRIPGRDGRIAIDPPAKPTLSDSSVTNRLSAGALAESLTGSRPRTSPPGRDDYSFAGDTRKQQPGPGSSYRPHPRPSHPNSHLRLNPPPSMIAFATRVINADDSYGRDEDSPARDRRTSDSPRGQMRAPAGPDELLRRHAGGPRPSGEGQVRMASGGQGAGSRLLVAGSSAQVAGGRCG